MIATAVSPEIILPYPHKGQRIVRRQAKRHNWLMAGRRWRKTTNEMVLGVEAMLRGQQIFWGMPTYDQVRVGWDESKHACGGVVDFSESRMIASFGKGRLIFRSLDNPDNARGYTADGVLIGEAAFVHPAAWLEVLRPMLMDTGGWSWASGTPNGRNWFWREWIGAQDREDSMAWQAPTLGVEITATGLVRKPHPLENPHVPFTEIQRMYETMPERIFRQEILAEAIEETGGVFRNLLACLNAPQTIPDLHKGHRIAAGVDWGKQSDYTAISLVCSTCHAEVARDRFNQIDYVVQRDRLRALWERWRPYTILAEQNSIGDPVIEVLHREGLPVKPFQTTPTSKPPLIESLALAFERAECQWQADPVWTSELEAYERKVSAQTGRSSYSAPEGLHDDTVMARALAWQATQRHGDPFGHVRLPEEARR